MFTRVEFESIDGDEIVGARLMLDAADLRKVSRHRRDDVEARRTFALQGVSASGRLCLVKKSQDHLPLPKQSELRHVVEVAPAFPVVAITTRPAAADCARPA